jgi:hypothetical protein
MLRLAGLPSRAAIIVLAYSTAAAAQDAPVPPLRINAAAAVQVAQAPAPSRQGILAPVPTNATSPAAANRPAALVPLYASFAVLQALDVHSTRYALDRGAVEANPLVKGLTGNEIGLVAVKAAGAAGLIFTSEHMWKRSKAGALLMMIASNSAMAWVVQHNYRTVR